MHPYNHTRRHPNLVLLTNALFCLIELGFASLAQEALEALPKNLQKNKQVQLICIAIYSHQQSPERAIDLFYSEKQHTDFSFGDTRLILHIIEQALDRKDTAAVKKVLEKIDPGSFPVMQKHLIDSYQIWTALYDHNWDDAGRILHQYPLTILSQEDSLLFVLYGIWLSVTESLEIAEAHFSAVMDIPFPRSYTLLAHRLIGKLSENSLWFQRSFPWERKQLFRQLALYYDCIGEMQESQKFKKFITKH